MMGFGIVISAYGNWGDGNGELGNGGSRGGLYVIFSTVFLLLCAFCYVTLISCPFFTSVVLPLRL